MHSLTPWSPSLARKRKENSGGPSCSDDRPDAELWGGVCRQRAESARAQRKRLRLPGAKRGWENNDDTAAARPRAPRRRRHSRLGSAAYACIAETLFASDRCTRRGAVAVSAPYGPREPAGHTGTTRTAEVRHRSR